jgi:hypothetical protein
MSFKVKDLAMNVGYVDGASTCSTWTRVSGASGNSCTVSNLFVDGAGGRNLAALKSQLRQAVARA